MDYSTTGLPAPHYLLKFVKFMSIASVMPSSHLILWCPLLLLPLIFPSTRDLSNELAVRIRWPKNWSFSFSNSPSNEYSKLISLTIDWFDLPALQGTFRSLLHHSLKASILWCFAFFMVQLSQPYMTTGKTTALTIQGRQSNVSAFQHTVYVCHSFPMDYFSAIKKNEILPITASWMNLENIMLSEISQRQINVIWYHLTCGT